MLERIRSDEAGPFVIVGGVVVLTTLLIGIAVSSSKIYEAVYHDYATSKGYAEAKQKFEQECASLPSIEGVVSCYRSVAESARQPQKSEEDLKAQKEMAQWAFWMVVVTGILGSATLLLTIIGVVYVIKTFSATRRQADAAEETIAKTELIGQAQVRAYLTCTSADITMENHWFGCWPTVKNSGNSPALDVHVAATVVLDRLPIVGKRFNLEEQRKSISEKSENIVRIIAAGDTTDINLLWSHTELGSVAYKGAREGWWLITVDLTIKWKDVFGKDFIMTVSLHRSHENRRQIMGDKDSQTFAMSPYTHFSKMVDNEDQRHSRN